LERSEVAAEAVLNRLPVKILKAPAPGMVMVRHVDPLERTPREYATERGREAVR
jgi:hypothetical protein